MKQLCTLSLSNLTFKKEFPANASYSFVSVLNPPIKSKWQSQLCLYLHSIIISSKFKGEYPAFVSVNLKETESQISCTSKKFDTIAEIPISQNSKFPLYLEVETQIKSVFDLNQISKLHFTIFHENKKHIDLEDSQSETVINLSVYQMENEKKSFTITCWPSLSENLFLNNSGGLFKTKLETPLIFNKKWQVGIKSILLPKNPSCVLKNDVWLECNGKRLTFQNFSCYTQEKDLEQVLREWFKSNFGGYNNGGYAFKFKKDIIFGKTATRETFNIKFSPMLAWIFNKKKDPEEYEFSIEEETFVTIKGGFDMKKLLPNYFEIYSDIIEKNYFGKKLEGFFGFFPNKNPQEVTIYEPKHIIYQNLNKNKIQEISFKIKTPSDHLLMSYDLQYPKITLIFTKIN